MTQPQSYASFRLELSGNRIPPKIPIKQINYNIRIQIAV
jgi:hypothetical protein